jgi:rSAM/selenodomain-associated transferase 2
VKPLHDVDRPEDVADLCLQLKHLEGTNEESPSDVPCDRISVVVPALNEERHLPGALKSAAAGENVEIIVVDGGSSDTTVKSARIAGAKGIQTEAGRARQMNAGAKEAGGEILLFLHADTLLPLGWDRYIRNTLRMRGVCAGAFEFSLDSKLPGIRFIERAANFRSRSLQIPYGDQAIFMTRSTFHTMGGFAEVPIMEDLEMVRRLRRLGRIHTVSAAVVTSARRWEKLGVWRTSLANQLLLLAYFCGISPGLLARWYSTERRFS